MTLPFKPYLSQLEKRHNRGAFTCGNTTLDDYLQKRASQDLKRRLTAIFVLQEEGKDEIIGYYGLSNLSIDAGALPDKTNKGLPQKRPIPCTLLAQFAVSEKWQGQGVSNWLLMNVYEKVWEQSQVSGSFALVVDAIDNTAQKYWQHNDFIEFPSTPTRLFLPMITIGDINEK